MKYSRNCFSCLLIVVLLLNLFPAASAEDAPVYAHPYLAYVIEDNGEITVTGFQKGKAVENVVIPDEIDGRPVTVVSGFDPLMDPTIEEDYYYIPSVIIGDNVRIVWGFNDCGIREVTFGKNVTKIGRGSFSRNNYNLKVLSWGESLVELGDYCFFEEPTSMSFPPLPDTVEYIGMEVLLDPPENYRIPASVKTYGFWSIVGNSFIILSRDMHCVYEDDFPFIPDTCRDTGYIYCYAGSTAEANAKQFGYTYYLIDGESLLFDGKPVEGNVLHLDHNMTEAELLPRLASDGAECEVRLGGLRDGKVVNGSTVTLWNTEVDAEGKVYTVQKAPEIESVAVETLPNKTTYFEGESFDPAGLTLRVTYDDGTSEVVSDGFTCTGMPTVTVTYSGCTTQFDVTVMPVCVKSVAIAALPKKTNYAYKEAFDPEGLTLTVTYNNGKAETVADGYTLHSADNLIVGKNTVGVSFGGKAAAFDITVHYTWWQHLIRIFLFGWLWY